MENSAPKSEYELYQRLQDKLDLEYNGLKATGAATGLDELFVSRVERLVERGYSPPPEFRDIVENLKKPETFGIKDD